MSTSKFKIKKAFMSKDGKQVVFSLTSKVEGMPRYWSMSAGLAVRELDTYFGGKDLRPADLLAFKGAKLVAEATIIPAGTTFENKEGETVERKKDALELNNWDFSIKTDNVLLAISLRKEQKATFTVKSDDSLAGITKVSEKAAIKEDELEEVE